MSAHTMTPEEEIAEVEAVFRTHRAWFRAWADAVDGDACQ